MGKRRKRSPGEERARTVRRAGALFDAAGLFWHHSGSAVSARTGVPEIWILDHTRQGHPGMVVTVQVKDTPLTPTQREYLHKMQARGWAAHICSSMEQIAAVVADRYGITPKDTP